MSTAALWSDLHDKVRGYVRRRVRTDADADDVVQDVFVRVHAHLGEVRDDEALQAWIWRVTRNTLVDHHRRRRDASELDEQAMPAEADVAEDLAGCLVAFVERLPEEYRDALRLTELEALSQKEAALRVGLSASGMRTRVQRGRARLKELFLECCHIELDRRGHVIASVPRCCPGRFEIPPR